MGLSGANTTIRAQALDLLQAIVMASFVPLEELMYLLLPGLGSQVPTMKSSTIIALVSLFKSHGDLMSRELINRIKPLAILLLKDHDKQVFRFSLTLIRVIYRDISF